MKCAGSCWAAVPSWRFVSYDGPYQNTECHLGATKCRRTGKRFSIATLLGLAAGAAAAEAAKEARRMLVSNFMMMVVKYSVS